MQNPTALGRSSRADGSVIPSGSCEIDKSVAWKYNVLVAQVIAILEDDEGRTEAMRNVLRERFPEREAVFFDNAPDMIAWLADNLSTVRLLCLDHDLGPNRQRGGQVFDPGIGRDVADFLATRQPACSVLIHSTNAQGAYGMQFALEDAGWTVERVVPFGDLSWVTTEWATRVAALAG